MEMRISHEERIDVPQRERETAYDLAHQIRREAALVSRRRRRIKIPAEGIRAMRVQHVPGCDDIALTLRHLLPLPIQDQPEADHVLIRYFIEQQRTDRMQRIEPTARLIDRLTDVIRRE